MLPIQLWLGAQPWAVSWMNVEGRPFHEPFFGDTLGKLRKSTPPPEERDTTLDTLTRLAGRMRSTAPAGLIFHISRCGSTLISNAFRIAAGVEVISEAQPFNAALMADIPEPVRKRVLRSLVKLYARNAEGRKLKLVIKCSSWNTLAIRLARSLWPNTPFVVVVRDPVEVMASNLASPSSWLEHKASPQFSSELFGWNADEVQRMSVEEYCARVLGRFCEAAEEVIDGKCMVVDYGSLDRAKLCQVGEFFGVPLARFADDLQATIAVHSKDAGRRMRFEDDRERKQQYVGDGVRAAAREWCEPAYRRLRRFAS
jgi:hypothetical protein